MTKNIKQYWRQFLNNQLIRDYRTQHSYNYGRSMNTVKKNKKLMRNDPKANFGKEFLNSLLKTFRLPAKCYYELSHYTHIGDMKNNNEKNRHLDRLLFDFDNSNEKLNQIKKDIQTTTTNSKLPYKNKIPRIKFLQSEFQEEVLNSDVLKTPYEECVKLQDYFIKNNIKSEVFFSGGKGFHLYVFFPSKTLNHDIYKYAIREIGSFFQKKLELTTLDPAPFSNIVKGLGRMPYGKHELSTLQTRPINILNSFDDIIDKISKPTNEYIDYFDIKSYESEDFSNFIDIVAKNTSKKLRMKELQKQQQKIIKRSKTNWNIKTKDNSVFDDCRILAKIILPDNYCSSNGEFDRYTCPFCENINDFIVSKKAFWCYHTTCRISYLSKLGEERHRKYCSGEYYGEEYTLNYFEFIKLYYDFDSNEAVKKKMKEIAKKIKKITE